MSDSPQAPGWYHAEGDPPGTQRYWDGTNWTGNPMPAGGAGAGGLGAGLGDPIGAELPYKGFFPTLFDFSFTSFITPKIMKVLYIVSIALIGLFGLIFLITSLASGGAGIVIALIVVPLVTLLYLVLTRMSYEMMIIMFRIYEQVIKK